MEVRTMSSREALMDQLNSRAALLDTVRGLRADLEGVIAEVGEARMEEPGSFGDWTFKDVLSHLTGWRLTTAARLEAGLRHEEPVFPWPAPLDEEHYTDEINRWFFETNHDKPVAEILRESRETFARVERAIEALTEDDLLLPDRFPWLGGWPLGPGVVSGTYDHYHEDHEPAIRAWLARG
jgi:hypothetical protein